MENSDTITVYWAPAPYILQEESWAMAYSEPVHLFSEHRKSKNPNGNPNNIFACPATKSTLNNTYVVNHQFDNVVDLPGNINPKFDHYWLETNSAIGVLVPRSSALTGYHNLMYNMGWLLFADEPLVARFTAPFFPPHTPAEGAMLSTGEFDIGSWYRAFNLDYHVPVSAKTLKFMKDDPLFYIEFKTDKNIILKRYNVSPSLNNLAMESVNAPGRYGRFQSLKERYGIAKKAMIPELVLSEIKKNLVE